jgi:glycosyltransferase involved in cell wall biosynthesis
LGFTPDEDLPALYNLATIYCQPSFAEGFGLTLVEAMQSGTPIIYSQKTCLPEIMGDAGLKFDPYQPKTLVKSIKNIWTNNELQKEQSILGIKQAKKYTWQKTAMSTLEAYDLVLKK